MKTSRLSILLAASVLALTGCFGGKSEVLSSEPGSEPSSQTPSSQTPSSEPSSQASSESSQETSSQGKKEGPYVEEPTTIVLWSTFNPSYSAIIDSAIANFAEMEPNVTVENKHQTGSYDDLRGMVVNGFAVDNFPDMAVVYPDSVAEFILNNKGLNMDPYMNNADYGWTEADFLDIPPEYIEAGQKYTIPGTYSLPNAKSTEALYYNQDALLGVDLHEIDATINDGKVLSDEYLQNLTWDELFDKLIPALEIYNNSLADDDKIMDTTQTDYAWVGYDSDDNFFITLAEQYGYGYTSVNQKTGAGKLDFNNDNMKNLMKKFKGYYDKHYLTTSANIGGGTRTNKWFTNGKKAMLFSIGSTGGVGYQLDTGNPMNVGVGSIPQAPGKDPKVISQGPDIAFLNHNDDNRALATWLFYKYFTGQTVNTSWSLTTGYSPVRYSVMETEEYQDASDYTQFDAKSKERLEALNRNYAGSVLDNLFTSPVFKGSAEARNQVGTIFSACCAAGAELDSKIDKIFQDAYDNTVLKM